MHASGSRRATHSPHWSCIAVSRNELCAIQFATFSSYFLSHFCVRRQRCRLQLFRRGGQQPAMSAMVQRILPFELSSKSHLGRKVLLCCFNFVLWDHVNRVGCAHSVIFVKDLFLFRVRSSLPCICCSGGILWASCDKRPLMLS